MLVVACVVACSAPVASPRGPAPVAPSSDGQVRALLDAWSAMWNTYDLDQVSALFVRDDGASYFSSEYAGAVRGLRALLEHHARFGFVPGGKQSQPNLLWLTEVFWHDRGEAIVVLARWHFASPKSPRPQTGPVTFVLVPMGSELRIAHAHFANDPAPKPETPPSGPTH